MKDATLALRSDPNQTLELRNTEMRKEIEGLIQRQVQRANLRTAQGAITVSLEGVSPLLLTLKHFEIQTPNFAELLRYVESENVSEIKQFVQVYNNANQQDLPSQRTALFYAVAGSKVSSVQTLLAAGSDPNLADFEGDTPLLTAVTSNSVDAARQLISAGAKVDQANQKGETPLIRTIELGRPEMLTLLLATGANPNYVLPDGKSVLALALEKRDRGAISLLQKSGASR